jgi:hypothetical protein
LKVNEFAKGNFSLRAGYFAPSERVPVPDAWGEIFGDEVTAVAMIDRLVHHAEILSLKGDSFRLRGRDAASRPPVRAAEEA